MVFKYLLLAVVMAVYVSGQDSSKVETTTPVVKILKQINEVNDDGSYTFGFEADDGTFKVETRDVDGNVKGKYGYLDDSGVLKTVEYNAGKTEGFTAAGDHLPEPVAPLPVAPVAQVPAVPAQSFNRFAPQQATPQQFAPQQFAPQQFAPQQFVPQQTAPQQFAPQQFAPQQFAPQQFAPQQFAPQQNSANFAAVRAPPTPALQNFNQFAAPQQFQGFSQGPLNSVNNNIDDGNQRKGFSFSFSSPATFPQPQQQAFNSFPQQNQFFPQQNLFNQQRF